MVRTPNAKYLDAKKGNTVRVRVADDDKSRINGRNILANPLAINSARNAELYINFLPGTNSQYVMINVYMAKIFHRQRFY